MAFTDNAGSKSINQREHNEDASAKRVVQYFQDASGEWIQAPVSLAPGVDYDYLDVQQTSATVETHVFKTGGAAGTTVQTITTTYTDSTKANIDTVVWG